MAEASTARTPLQRVARGLRAGLGWLAVAFGLVALALAFGALVPANRGWTEPPAGSADTVDIFVETNGVHTGFVLPVFAAGVNWYDDFPITDADAALPATHVLVGWGSRDFYLNTPTWADLDWRVAARAAFGLDSSLLHIDHLANPTEQVWRRPLRLTVAQYRELAADIRRFRAPGAAIAGYTSGDVFYPATGRYSAVHSCNEWMGARLRAAGVRTGRWTPLAADVMRWR